MNEVPIVITSSDDEKTNNDMQKNESDLGSFRLAQMAIPALENLAIKKRKFISTLQKYKLKMNETYDLYNKIQGDIQFKEICQKLWALQLEKDFIEKKFFHTYECEDIIEISHVWDTIKQEFYE